MTASHNAWNNRRNCGEGGEEDGESHRQVRRLHIKGDFPDGLVRWLSAHPIHRPAAGCDPSIGVHENSSTDGHRQRLHRGPGAQLAHFLLSIPPGNGVGGDDTPIYTAEVAIAMKTVEERLTIVEHQVAENARGIDGLREAVVKGFEAMDRRFEAIDRRFDAIDQRFDAIDRRFETIDRRFETIDRRFETSDQRFGAINQTMDRRFEAMDQKLSRQFFWLVGTLVVILLTILTR